MSTIALLAGSSRPDSQSGKVARYLSRRLVALQPSLQVELIDLALKPLPLWPAAPAEHWPDHAEILRRADALVLVSPEWNGMACPAVKNFFLYAGRDELAHKPCLLVGVSSGIGGAYPISELRASGYKNCRLCHIPEHLIIRQVEKVMNEGDAADAEDARIRRRSDYALQVLLQYTEALASIRGRIEMAEFPTGM
mgnify:CR=1 FL=1